MAELPAHGRPLRRPVHRVSSVAILGHFKPRHVQRPMEGWRRGGPWLPDAYSTVAENACLNCHRPHAASHPEWLMAQVQEQANCTICHDGTMVQKNIAQQFLEPSRHPIEARQWTHNPKEDPLTMPRHVTCVDCHNPHAAEALQRSGSTMRAANETAPITSGPLRGVSGVTMSGGATPQARYEYEVCLKCHGLAEPTTPGILRQETTRNIRLKIGPSSSLPPSDSLTRYEYHDCRPASGIYCFEHDLLYRLSQQ